MHTKYKMHESRNIIEFISHLTSVCLFWLSVLQCFNSCTPGIIFGSIFSRGMGVASRWNYNGEL